ncbi:alpha/beta fold hydrolase [Ornithinimicrobium murale]|uniref:alpha/beta fold hydrolase n=1 Tax=Ornithinimicrobium murale TaxID=1050153 RepID=UPI000E0D5AA7|nr:hypothetical protein [Ornithinimicrobium murale]
MAAINGPWQQVPGPGGGTAPFYMIRFDKRGVCTSPSSLRHLVQAAGEATDVFLFSHGWNNTWEAATRHYLEFIDQFNQQYAEGWHPPARDYRPVLVGVNWPSTVLVPRDERGPDIAGGQRDPSTGEDLALELIAESLEEGAAARLYELAGHAELSGERALELARLVAPALTGLEDELGDGRDATITPEDLLRWWAAMPSEDPAEPVERGGFVEDEPVGADRAPETAGLLDKLNPRNLIRSATVLLMKDRAGRVGGAGVRSMLHDLLDSSPDSRVRLIGHSYGGKVVLSALAHGSAPKRPVESVLLLQPATSAKCFADPDREHPAGGYRPALDRARQPVMTTFSRHDVPLTRLFHLAARRASDTREAVIAGAPSEYAALGGFGPQDTSSVTVVDAVTAPKRYVLPSTEVLAIRADAVINGHGDVQNAATAWALLCQVME